jgi:hypothetical protein
MAVFALIHSPLVGPTSWKPVADHLGSLGYPVYTPTLVDSKTDARPFWEQHAASAAQAIQAAPDAEGLVLVGHSGAGPILPAIGDRLDTPPTGYIFVDAGLPKNQASRLDLMRLESKEWAAEFEKFLLNGGRFPDWTEKDLHQVIPDKLLRQQVVRELKPRSMPFFTERITISEHWTQTPCGYVQFTETYAIHADHARRLGWPTLRIQGKHFHMVVAPRRIAQALIEIEKRISEV